MVGKITGRSDGVGEFVVSLINPIPKGGDSPSPCSWEKHLEESRCIRTRLFYAGFGPEEKFHCAYYGLVPLRMRRNTLSAAAFTGATRRGRKRG